MTHMKRPGRCRRRAHHSERRRPRHGRHHPVAGHQPALPGGQGGVRRPSHEVRPDAIRCAPMPSVEQRISRCESSASDTFFRPGPALSSVARVSKGPGGTSENGCVKASSLRLRRQDFESKTTVFVPKSRKSCGIRVSTVVSTDEFEVTKVRPHDFDSSTSSNALPWTPEQTATSSLRLPRASTMSTEKPPLRHFDFLEQGRAWLGSRQGLG